MERLDRLLMASAGLAPGMLTFSFRPLWQMDAATKAATALQKAQATAIYAGLGLWPKPVMAGLVAGQLAEDGIYPDAGAAFEAAETDGEPQPVRDYSPDQPRDPQGRWTEGGGHATSGNPDDPAPETAQADPPRSLTIYPKAGQPSGETTSAQQSRTANSLLGLIGKGLSALNPISTAHAEEGNHSELFSGTTHQLPDTTPIELSSGSKRGGVRAIVGLFIGAARFARWLGEHFESDDPEPPNPVDHPKGTDDDPPFSPSPASESSKRPKKFTPQESAGLVELFKGGGKDGNDKGAQALLDQLSKGPVKLPQNVTREVLERYAKTAQDAIDEGIDKKGV